MECFPSASFSQFNELEADAYSADLCYAAGYSPVAGAKLWKRLAKRHDEEPSDFKNFFRTHPFSIKRYECLKKHIGNIYGLEF